MARFNIVVKCIFCFVVVLGAGFAIERFTRIKYSKLGHSLALKDVVYNVSSHLEFENFETVLRKNYVRCVTNPSKPICLTSVNKVLQILQGNESYNAEVVKSRWKNMTAGLEAHAKRINLLLIDFTQLMEKHNVKVMLVEPSILFCLLSDARKNDMVLKGFNPSKLLGSRNVITMGVLSEDSAKLEGANLTKEALSVGFELDKFRRWIVSGTDKSFESVHYIFRQQDIAVHVVVFYPWEAYWWHAGMDAQTAVQENLLFMEEGIFEKFLLLPLKLDGTSIRGMYLPHDIRYFMLQIEASNFVQCNGTISNNFYVPKHPSMTMEKLNNIAEVALKELKAILAPQLVLFWLWSYTLLGWSSKCDIFHYSTSLELAVMHKSIEGLDLDTLISGNDNLEVSNHTEMASSFEYRILCHGLEINLSILQEEEKSLRMERKDEMKNFNLIYPKFTLCSTNLYNLKTLVPCVPKDVLKVEEKLNDFLIV